MPVKIFFCYAHEDEPLLIKLRAHLIPLQRLGLIDVWHDRDISAGTEWEREINEHLNTAQIILLLISPDFMASDYCYSIEMKRAVERHERGEARVIPIILRHTLWKGTPFDKLQALPTDGKPVLSAEWHSLDEAFFDIVSGIRKLAERPPKFILLDTLKYPRAVNSVTMSSDTYTIITGSEDGAIKIWNLQTGQLLHTLTDDSSPVTSVAISSRSKTIASGGWDNAIRLWSLDMSIPFATLTVHSRGVDSVAISTEGRTLVSGSRDRTIGVWDLPSGMLLHTLTGHSGYVLSVAISTDGQILASGSFDRTIKLWNLNSGQLLNTLTGHTSSVNRVAISADGQTLVSGSDDGTIKVWNYNSGQLLHTFLGHNQFVSGIIISTDGQIIVSGSYDRTVKIWKKQEASTY